MIQLSYDNTFEGLLTVIFEIYEYKYVDAIIVKTEYNQKSLFGERTIVITNVDKANRVLIKLESLLGKEGIRQLLYAFASEDESVEKIIANVIFYAISCKGKNVLHDYSNNDVLQLSKWVKSVGREKHRMEAFVRFELLKDEIYFAKICPDFDVLPLIINHFKERYQDQKWLIYDERRKYGIFYDLHEVEIVTLPDQNKLFQNRDAILHDTEINYQNLWIEYFDHTNIKERKNTKLHLQHVPKRYWRYLTEKR
ncbi:DNA metabolism protein [Flavobacterium sp. 9AF]|uniref:TIGR03915 family putative DNA repair protein n=1 Tax=Flavobacterium sp. 9AF TaxID=2653142 RepID=UPI0012F2C70E|nr:TIGR03915 family putative DNA repair protein [Flavobacterium sp. 9AF]VXC42492.1 DNA metabolism protein [Flavobacterium sp. 9AF]